MKRTSKLPSLGHSFVLKDRMREAETRHPKLIHLQPIKTATTTSPTDSAPIPTAIISYPPIHAYVVTVFCVAAVCSDFDDGLSAS